MSLWMGFWGFILIPKKFLKMIQQFNEKNKKWGNFRDMPFS